MFPATIATMKKDITQVALGTALLLCIPLVAMQITNEVNWDLSDFIVMGTLLFAAGLALKSAMQVYSTTKRILVVTAIVLAFFYIWAELAVGIFNIPGISGS